MHVSPCPQFFWMMMITMMTGSHNFLPSPRLPSQLHSVAAFARYQFILHDEQSHT